MRTIYNRAKVILILCLVVVVGLTAVMTTFVLHGNEYVMKPQNQHLYSGGALTCGGTIVDRNEKVLVSSNESGRYYNDSSSIRKSTLHVIGDQYGYIKGIEARYSSELVGYNLPLGIFNAQKSAGNTLKLTIDADLCSYALDCLGGQKGAIGVYNYRTGEIICNVSSPTYDLLNKPSGMDENENYSGVYLNKLLYGQYVPGSVYKVVTACCAIENIPDIMDRTFSCTGSWKVPGGGEVICNDNHGTLTFEQAFNQSCNVAFGQIAIELGADKLTKTVKELGLISSIQTDRTSTAVGKFNLKDASDEDIAWAGFGQYTVVANPCSIMVMMGAIANNGIAIQPYSVSSIDGIFNSYEASTSVLGSYMSNETATKLQQILRSTVTDYYGEGNFYGLEISAKSGTAEISDEIASHSWFAGYSSLPDFPYAFVVIVENGGSGYYNAGSIASYVMQRAYYLLNNNG
ncbi:MAG TPA: penicillin-binding protein [Clostridiales bacterium]|nr:penicillin-binding protein [Clostridiales bacterium]